MCGTVDRCTYCWLSRTRILGNPARASGTRAKQGGLCRRGFTKLCAGRRSGIFLPEQWRYRNRLADVLAQWRVVGRGDQAQPDAPSSNVVFMLPVPTSNRTQTGHLPWRGKLPTGRGHRSHEYACCIDGGVEAQLSPLYRRTLEDEPRFVAGCKCRTGAVAPVLEHVTNFPD